VSEIVVSKSTVDEASIVWEKSPHSTIFTNPSVLAKMSHQVNWYVAKKGDELLCAWPVCIDEKHQIYTPPFSYYVGPFWSDIGWKIPSHRSLARRLEVYDAFMRKFEDDYGGFICSLPIGLHDVRPFDWWNYHDNDKPRVSIFPRYTAQVTELTHDYPLEVYYRELRRRELKKVERAARYTLGQNVSSETIFDLYASTMERQGQTIDGGVKKSIEILHNLVLDGYGYLTVVHDNETQNRVAYVALLLRASGVSNLVLNLTHEDYRGTGVSAYGIHNSIIMCIDLGDTVFDFNGANSPKRGDDKHSYGAKEKLYFDIDYHLKP
jgi:hypothetical protein